MAHVSLEQRDGLALVKMGRGKANALNREMLGELATAVMEVAADDRVQGLVLGSDRPGFFSAGFDVAEVFAYTRPEMGEFFGRFIDLYESLRRVPMPAVAALSGHAYAGGAILALACDVRLMASGRVGFALNEVNLGIVLPPGIVRMLVDAVGAEHARRLLLGGEALAPQRALEIGLVQELAEGEELLERAVSVARLLADKPPQAFATVKRTLGDVTGEGESDRAHLGTFLDHWFSAEAEERKAALAASVKR